MGSSIFALRFFLTDGWPDKLKPICSPLQHALIFEFIYNTYMYQFLSCILHIIVLVGFCPSGFLSQVFFVLLGFCPVGFCPSGFLS